MREQVGFLGIGLCGGNIASGFEQRGYNCAYLNTSQEDLSSLKEVKHTIHIENSEGAFKNRTEAKRLAVQDIETIMDRITKVLTQKFIFVCASTAGGTGSGLAPAISEILVNKYNKIPIPVLALPKNRESVTALKNAYQCLSEIEKVRTGALFILDNEKKEDIFEINRIFTDNLDALLSSQTQSSRGNMDKAEIKHLLSTKGFSIVTSLKDKPIIPAVLKTIKSNVYAPMQNDNVVKYIGIIQSTQQDIIKSIIAEVGQPLDQFIGYDSKDTIVFLNGLTMPINRLNELKEKVIENKATVSNILNALNTPKLDNDLDFFDDMVNESSKTDNTPITNDLLSLIL